MNELIGRYSFAYSRHQVTHEVPVPPKKHDKFARFHSLFCPASPHHTNLPLHHNLALHFLKATEHFHHESRNHPRTRSRSYPNPQR
ncbi:hypothetical protein [Rubritalea tangerina]|uniref:hypothetical protein n=1 Tax=Rubritalea tangerina TaxID=430798 RepID=UPI0036145085